jgi:hypothetical protein
MIGRGDLAGQCDGEARGSDGASTRSFALLRRAFPRQPALILAQGLYLFSAVHAARRAWPAGVWTFPRTDFGPRPKVLPRNLVDAAEVHAGQPQLAANEEQPSLPKSADASKASAVECILSRRDSMRHEVPGKASLERTVP